MFDVSVLSVPSVSKITEDVISTIHFFEKNQYTYTEAEAFADMLTQQIKFMRECREYNSYSDYFAGKKSVCLDNAIITAKNPQSNKS